MNYDIQCKRNGVYIDGKRIGYVDRVERHGPNKWQIRIDGIVGAEYWRIGDMRFDVRWVAEKFIIRYWQEHITKVV